MIRKILLALLALLVIAAILFFTFGPELAERSMNTIDGKELPELRSSSQELESPENRINMVDGRKLGIITAEAQALHDSLTIVDLHADTLLWSRDILKRADRGHVDFPRLQDGNVALQIFSSVTKTPTDQNYDSNSADGDNITALVIGQMQPVRTWHSLLERSLWHAQKRNDASMRSDWQFKRVDAASDLEALLRERAAKDNPAPPTGAMLSVEGLHNLEGNPKNLDRLYDAGFRMASLTHFFDNDLAGSMHGEAKGGLTQMGRDVVRRMERRGMIVDIAHLSHAGVAEVLAMARRPVVSSHGGVQATCNVNRNLTDDEIRGVARTGGIIGVGYWEGAVCDTSPAAIAKAVKHIRDLVGIRYVALGSDFDGAVTVRFDTSGLIQVTQGLMDAGFTEAEIRAVMGGNALRVLSAGLEPAP